MIEIRYRETLTPGAVSAFIVEANGRVIGEVRQLGPGAVSPGTWQAQPAAGRLVGGFRKRSDAVACLVDEIGGFE